jgi:predicted MFS family arabinose efflux permease
MADSSIPTAPDRATTAAATAVAPSNRRLALAFIVLSNVLLNFGFQVWRALFNNFAVEELGVRADQMGLIQAIREVPGLVGFSVGLLALFLSEMRIAGLSVILMGVGIALTGRSDSTLSLVASTLVMSVGFHFFLPTNSSAVMQLVGEDEAPRTLGRLSSLNALAAVVSAGVVFLTLDALGFRTLFYAVGVLLVVGGLALLPWGRQPARSTRARRRPPLRRQYWLYYVLEFLMGSRRHIFTTFAVFLLVQEHNVAAQTVTILYVINNLIGTFFYQQFGKVIPRAGERRILTLNFLLLIVVFLGYAYVSLLPVLYVLFVIDHVLFGFRIALESYFQKIAVHPEEITPNLALGQTINHIASVVLPLIGGIVWAVLGSRYTFLIGVGIAVASLVVVQWMRTERSGIPAPAAAGK